jgi:hypothetical protein
MNARLICKTLNFQTFQSGLTFTSSWNEQVVQMLQSVMKKFDKQKHHISGPKSSLTSSWRTRSDHHKWAGAHKPSELDANR